MVWQWAGRGWNCPAWKWLKSHSHWNFYLVWLSHIMHMITISHEFITLIYHSCIFICILWFTNRQYMLYIIYPKMWFMSELAIFILNLSHSFIIHAFLHAFLWFTHRHYKLYIIYPKIWFMSELVIFTWMLFYMHSVMCGGLCIDVIYFFGQHFFLLLLVVWESAIFFFHFQLYWFVQRISPYISDISGVLTSLTVLHVCSGPVTEPGS